MRSLLWIGLALCCALWSPASFAGGGRGQAKAPKAQQSTRSHRSFYKSSSSEGAWMSLSQYQRLRKRAWRRGAPRWARIGEARYQARRAAGGLEITGTLQLQAEGKGWHQVELLPVASPLYAATLNGKAAWILPPRRARGSRRLLFRGAGSHTLVLRFFLPRMAGPDPQVQLSLPPATSSRFEVRFAGKGFRPKLKAGLAVKVSHDAKGTSLSARIAPGTAPILSWWQASHGHSSAKSKKRNARLYARTYALLSAGRGGQELFLTVRYTIVHASREEFRLFIPKGIHVRQVHGLGIRDYRIRPFTHKGQRGHLLDVLLVEAVSERYELSLLAEHRRDKGEIALRLPQPLQIQRETGYLGMEVIGNDALTVQPQGATSIDVQELPPEIIRGTKRPILRAYRFTKRPATWRFRVHRHQNVSVPAAIIDQALYLQVANHRGQTWVQATYQVRNTFKQFIAIALPKGAEIQSAFVGGKPVKPARDKKGRVLVPLKRSGKASGQAFPVEVVYSLKSAAFRDRSSHKASLPSVDLWISSLKWQLYLPEGRVHWHQNLGRERPRGYSIWTLGSSDNRSKGRLRGKWRKAPQQLPQVQSNKIRMPGGTQAGKSTGLLPVRIRLPRRGRLYIFHRYHLAPHSATRLQYRHQVPYIGTIGLGLFLLGGLLLGFILTLLVLHSPWSSFPLWLLFLVSAGCLMMGYRMAATVAYRVVVLGAFMGLVLAAALVTLRTWDKKPAEP